MRASTQALVEALTHADNALISKGKATHADIIRELIDTIKEDDPINGDIYEEGEVAFFLVAE